MTLVAKAGCGCPCHASPHVHHVTPCCRPQELVGGPTLTEAQEEAVRLFRAVTRPAPPEDDVPDPDYGF